MNSALNLSTGPYESELQRFIKRNGREKTKRFVTERLAKATSVQRQAIQNALRERGFNFLSTDEGIKYFQECCP